MRWRWRWSGGGIESRSVEDCGKKSGSGDVGSMDCGGDERLKPHEPGSAHGGVVGIDEEKIGSGLDYSPKNNSTASSIQSNQPPKPDLRPKTCTTAEERRGRHRWWELNNPCRVAVHADGPPPVHDAARPADRVLHDILDAPPYHVQQCASLSAPQRGSAWDRAERASAVSAQIPLVASPPPAAPPASQPCPDQMPASFACVPPQVVGPACPCACRQSGATFSASTTCPVCAMPVAWAAVAAGWPMFSSITTSTIIP